jgi:UDP-glucuronate 4-epimerase
MRIALRLLLLFGTLIILLVLTSGTSFAAAAEAVQVAFTSPAPTVTTRRQLPRGSAVLVTGGAGFVGFHLSMRLHRDGVRVVALDNFDPYYSTALKRARQARLQAAGI